ncbi:hypothetical protein NPIL_397301 [Nephila pilipes]|uniref:Uncharacterized protein n=1 Tax=Nephila pilipes TaxID=299642 RepID=A0A8X6U1R0_NEPPI|nr:hypothetical protein NPIL_397301 [Nephila pilipes]
MLLSDVWEHSTVVLPDFIILIAIMPSFPALSFMVPYCIEYLECNEEGSPSRLEANRTVYGVAINQGIPTRLNGPIKMAPGYKKGLNKMNDKEISTMVEINLAGWTNREHKVFLILFSDF